MGKGLYKIKLRVDFKKETNIDDKFPQIRKLTEEFSDGEAYSNDVKLMEIRENTITILASFSSSIDEEKGVLININPLLKNISNLFNVAYDRRKRYFRIESYEILSESQYNEVLESITAGKMEASSGKKKLESNEEKIKEEESTEAIPQRTFPYIASVMQRSEVMAAEDYASIESYKYLLEKVDSLIGMREVKSQIHELADFIRKNNERYISLNVDNPGLFYNTLISGNEGTGKSTIARLISELFYSLGVIGKGKIFSIDYKDFFPGFSIERTIGNAQSGVIIINYSSPVQSFERRGNNVNFIVLKQLMKNYKKNFVFVIIADKKDASELNGDSEFKSSINFEINIPDYCDEELLELVNFHGKREGYEIDEGAYETIFKIIKYYIDKGIFKNIYTAEQIIDRAVINKLLKGQEGMLMEEDFHFNELNVEAKDSNKDIEDELDPMEELESLIGLSEVKKKVREIASFAALQLKRKEMGLKQEKICFHMCFTGAPGTCKTTVARCVGKIFKKLGILSKGNFVEAAREDLCGRYIGHTASMTAEKVNEARGGILFIDEVYSLVSGSDRDYGREAVNTLVKKMEDLRDDLVVIFAGYPKETEEFLKMNPGLRSRVTFHISFPDYSPLELLEIWKKFYKDSSYQVAPEAEKEMKAISCRICNSRSDDFANGRTIRNYFERTKMIQAVRVLSNNLSTTEDLVSITGEDVLKLKREIEDLQGRRELKNKQKIGFVG